MYIQKLHHICNISSPDDDPKSGRTYLGNKQLRKIHQSIPAKYYKIQRKYETINKKTCRQKMSIMFNKICIYIYIYIYIYEEKQYFSSLMRQILFEIFRNKQTFSISTQETILKRLKPCFYHIMFLVVFQHFTNILNDLKHPNLPLSA